MTGSITHHLANFKAVRRSSLGPIGHPQSYTSSLVPRELLQSPRQLRQRSFSSWARPEGHNYHRQLTNILHIPSTTCCSYQQLVFRRPRQRITGPYSCFGGLGWIKCRRCQLGSRRHSLRPHTHPKSTSFYVFVRLSRCSLSVEIFSCIFRWGVKVFCRHSARRLVQSFRFPV